MQFYDKYCGQDNYNEPHFNFIRHYFHSMKSATDFERLLPYSSIGTSESVFEYTVQNNVDTFMVTAAVKTYNEDETASYTKEDDVLPSVYFKEVTKHNKELTFYKEFTPFRNICRNFLLLYTKDETFREEAKALGIKGNENELQKALTTEGYLHLVDRLTKDSISTYVDDLNKRLNEGSGEALYRETVLKLYLYLVEYRIHDYPVELNYFETPPLVKYLKSNKVCREIN